MTELLLLFTKLELVESGCGGCGSRYDSIFFTGEMRSERELLDPLTYGDTPDNNRFNYKLVSSQHPDLKWTYIGDISQYAGHVCATGKMFTSEGEDVTPILFKTWWDFLPGRGFGYEEFLAKSFFDKVINTVSPSHAEMFYTKL